MERLHAALDALRDACAAEAKRSEVAVPMGDLLGLRPRDRSELIIERRPQKVLPALAALCELCGPPVDGSSDSGPPPLLPHGFLDGVVRGCRDEEDGSVDAVLLSRRRAVEESIAVLLSVPERVSNALCGVRAAPEPLQSESFVPCVCHAFFSGSVLHQLRPPSLAATAPSQSPDIAARNMFMRVMLLKLIRRGSTREVASAISEMLLRNPQDRELRSALAGLWALLPGASLSPLITALLGADIAGRRVPELLSPLLEIIDLVLFAPTATLLAGQLPPAASASSDGHALLREREAALPSWKHEVFSAQLVSKRQDRRVIRGLIKMVFSSDVARPAAGEALLDSGGLSRTECRLYAVREVFAAWDSLRTVQFGDEATNGQLTNAVMYLLIRIDPKVLHSGAEECHGPVLEQLLNGISHRMSSPHRSLQKLGSLVAAKFSAIMAKSLPPSDDLEPINFDAFPDVLPEWERFDEAGEPLGGSVLGQHRDGDASSERSPKRALPPPDVEADPDEIIQPGLWQESGNEAATAASDQSRRVGYSKGGLQVAPPTGVSDELPSFGLTDTAASDEALREKRVAVHYLKDAVRILTTSGPESSGTEDKTEPALLSLPKLLECSTDEEIVVVSHCLVLALVALPCTSHTQELADAQFESLVLLTMKAPVQVLDLFSVALYSHSYTMMLRISILKVIAEAVTRLAATQIVAKGAAVPVPSTALRGPKRIYPPIADDAAVSQQKSNVLSLVSARIEAKSRRWGSALHPPSDRPHFENRLVPHAERFTATLTQRYDRGHYKLLADEVFVGVELLRTVLSIVTGLSVATHTLAALAPGIVDFVLQLVVHRDPPVRSHAWFVLYELFRRWRRAATDALPVVELVLIAAEAASRKEEDHVARGCAMDVASLLQHDMAIAVIPETDRSRGPGITVRISDSSSL